MIKVGITGQAGFVGSNLYNTLGLYPDVFERIPFEDSFFQDENTLRSFVSQCDTIVHLAALNRHNDSQVLYKMNLHLVEKLILACEHTKSTPHIIFSSSTQEERNTAYGRSKKEGRHFFEQWAKKNNAEFSGLIIPNVYGPFGHANYNSVIATFCHQLTHNETPNIEIDGELKLIYVAELIRSILYIIELHYSSYHTRDFKQNNHIIAHSELETLSNKILHNVKKSETIVIPPTNQIKVSTILEKLTFYKYNYFEKGTIPDLNNIFDRNLFFTFQCYIDHASFFPFRLNLNRDNRGSFVEVAKLNSGGQVSFSNTTPYTVTRGNHFHTRKFERFAVIKGKARIEMRRVGTDNILVFDLDGNQPSFVDMPIWHTHNITNIGNEELFTLFWINEHYNPNDPDTFFEKV